MDCCNYGEYRAYGGGGGARAWDAYAPYAHAQQPPYAPHVPYAPRPYYAHEHYARYGNRYDYPLQHFQRAHEHSMPIEYGSYGSKENRIRRSTSRRDGRARTPVQHLPMAHTPPLECGLTGRPGYYEQPMWHHYQMSGMMGGGGGGGGGGWGGGSMFNSSAWSARAMACRDQMRYANDYMPLKSYQHSNQLYPQGDRSTPYSLYEESPLSAEGGWARRGDEGGEYGAVPVPSPLALKEPPAREKPAPDRLTPLPQIPPPTLVPLPAFQQAFGSTEIGKFAEAFSRTETALGETANNTFAYESFSDWEAPSENHWLSQLASREIKCEDTF